MKFSTFILLVIGHIILILPATADNKPQCTYCGKWKPFSSVGSKRHRIDLLVIEENRITLPGCKPIDISIIETEAKARNYGAPPSAKTKPIRVIMASKNNPKCESRIAIPHIPILIEINMRPRGRVEGWEILHAEVFESSHLEELLASGNTIKKNNKNIRSPHPPIITKWWLLRNNHNPCDEGTRMGESICRSLHSL